MKDKKIIRLITILGARPQFIKAAALSRSIGIRKHYWDDDIEEIIVHMDQHYDRNRNQIFSDHLNSPKPKYDIVIGSALHGELTGSTLKAIEPVLLGENPD